jgi:hypothetical protein
MILAAAVEPHKKRPVQLLDGSFHDKASFMII